MDFLQQSFSVRFDYKIFFTNHLFNKENSLLQEFFRNEKKSDTKPKIFFVLDEHVVSRHHDLSNRIKSYFNGLPYLQLVDEMLVVPGGEAAKNDEKLFRQIVTAVNTHKIDRHSYLVAVG